MLRSVSRAPREYNGQEYSEYSGIRVNTAEYVSSRALVGVHECRYSTFCELAGEDPADLEAQQANAWLRARRLPQLPPVDGVSHWAALAGVFLF